MPIAADGGPGSDVLVGGFADDVLDGGSGDDTLTKGTANSMSVTIPAEGDVLRGGEGTDEVAYLGAIAHPAIGVHVTIDGIANDSRPGRMIRSPKTSSA